MSDRDSFNEYDDPYEPDERIAALESEVAALKQNFTRALLQARRTAEYWKIEHFAGNEVIEGMREDAERYRFFRMRFAASWQRRALAKMLGCKEFEFDPSLDAAIDAARKGSSK